MDFILFDLIYMSKYNAIMNNTNKFMWKHNNVITIAKTHVSLSRQQKGQENIKRKHKG